MPKKKKAKKKNQKKTPERQKWRKIPFASMARGFKQRAAPKNDLSVHAEGVGRMYKSFDGMNQASKNLRRLEAEKKNAKSNLACVVYRDIDKADSDSPSRFSFQYKLMKRAIQTKVFGAHDFIVPFVHLNPGQTIAFGCIIKFEGVIFCGQVYGHHSHFADIGVTRKLVTEASLLGSVHYPGHDFKLCAEGTSMLFKKCMRTAIETTIFQHLQTFSQALLLRADNLDATAIVRALFQNDHKKGGTDIVNHIVLKDKVELMKMLIAVLMDHDNFLPIKFYPRDFC